MRFVVVGAGAIGAYVGALLARAGMDIVLIARGPHLRAMQAHGVRVKSASGDFEAHPPATDDLAAIRSADVVFLGVKAHTLPALAPTLAALVDRPTAVVSMQNGIPWWYFFHGIGGALEDLQLDRVDPDRVIASSIDPRQVVGSIVYLSNLVIEPGIIHHIEGDRITLGEPDGSRSPRCRKIAAALRAAGLRCAMTTRIRHEIWVKLLGNVPFNPISALTRATLSEMMREPEVARLVREVMTEVQSLASRLGVELPVSIDQRMAGAEKVGAHRTSMLQDLEAGRGLELEPVVGAVVELGQRLGIPMPATQAVYACTKLLSRTHKTRDSHPRVD